MRKSQRVLFLLIAMMALSASVIAGCGGGDDSSSGDVTTEAYITKADAICTKGDEENAAAVKAAFGNQQPTEEEATAYMTDDLVPALETQLEDLRALTPPEGDADTVNEIYDGLEDALNKIKDDPKTALTSEDPFADVTAEAEAYGFKSCGVN